MSAMRSEITSLTTVYSSVYTGTDPRKHQSSESLTFVGADGFPAQMDSNAKNVSIWWRRHVYQIFDRLHLMEERVALFECFKTVAN